MSPEELEMRVAELEGEIDTLRVELEAPQGTADERADEIRDYEARITELEDSLSDIAEGLENLRAKIRKVL